MNCKHRKMLAPVVILLLFAFIWRKAGIFFEMNDDKLITEILSGVQTGGPDAHAEFINYFLALPISLLYRISKGVPWYGLCLIFFQALAYIGILESLYSRCRNVVETMLGTLVTAALILAGLYPLCCIEFTSTAAILAAAGYFCLLVQPEGRRRWIWFFVLELLSCCLRKDAMLMMQPMGVLTAWGVTSTRGGSFSLRRRAAKAGCVLAVPAAVLLIMALGDAIGYQGADWAEYRQFRADRSTIVDYGEGAPHYEEVKEILDRHQVTEADYEAFRNNVVLDWIISPACMKELVAHVDEHRVKMDVGGLLESLWRNKWVVYYWNMRNLRYVPAVLWIAVILGIALSRQIYVFGGAFGILCGKTVCLGYLLYKGRLPLRVSVPLLLGEVFLLLVLLLYVGDGWKSRLEKAGGGRRIGRCLVVAVSCCFLFACFSAGVQQYFYVREVNDAQRAMMEEAREIEAYCSASPEKRYVLDAWSVHYYSGSALETQIYQGRNNVVSGSWYSNSPCVRRYHAQYFSGAEEIYFIVYDDGRGEEHPGLRWLTEETGGPPEVCDSFTTTSGAVLLVWRYELTAGETQENKKCVDMENPF